MRALGYLGLLLIVALALGATQVPKTIAPSSAQSRGESPAKGDSPALVNPRPTVVPPQATSLWRSGRSKSSMDDSPAYMASVRGLPFAGRFGRMHTPILQIECNERQLRFYIVWEQFINTRGARVRLRFDDLPAQTHSMNVSTGRDTTGFWGTSAAPLLRALRGKSYLTARVVPYGEDEIETRFPIREADEHVKEVLATCAKPAPRK